MTDSPGAPETVRRLQEKPPGAQSRLHRCGRRGVITSSVRPSGDPAVSIIVGYIPTPEGRAALHRAADEAKLRHTKLIVVNSHRGSDFDAEEAVALEREFEEVVRDLR